MLWIPPLLDQLRRDPGNLSILRDNFTHPDAPYLGLGTVAEVVIVQFNLLGPWLLGHGRHGTDVGAVVGCIGFVMLWAAAVRAAWRRRASSELHLHVVLAIVAVLAVVSVSRIFGLYLEYTVRWMWLITGTVVAASVLSLWRAHPLPMRWWRAAALSGIGLATAGLLVASLQFADRAGPTGAVDSRIVAGLVDRSSAASTATRRTSCAGPTRARWARRASA